MSAGNDPVSIVIATRNRRDETLRAIGSCYAQDHRPIEVLLFDDASDDGTASAVESAFPHVRAFRNAERVGYIVNRNRGFREAKGRYVISIDDDAYFTGADTVSRVVRRFAEDPAIGAVAIPYVEPLDRQSVSSRNTPFRVEAGEELRNYVGCAHAVRKDVALSLGGYRDFFVHQGEERDFGLRLHAAGWRLVYGDGSPIVHLVSPNRDAARIWYYGVRNQILFAVLNAPFPEVLARVPWTVWSMIRYRFLLRTVAPKLKGLATAFVDSAKYLGSRKAVSRAAYRKYHRLPAHGPEAWDGPIPPPVSVSRPN